MISAEKMSVVRRLMMDVNFELGQIGHNRVEHGRAEDSIDEVIRKLRNINSNLEFMRIG